MRRAAKKDGNHNEVADYLRSQGWSVLDLWRLPEAGCDMAVSKERFAALVECKSPDGDRKLTEVQQKVKDGWQGPYIIALTGEQAHADLCLEMLRARHFFVPHQGE